MFLLYDFRRAADGRVDKCTVTALFEEGSFSEAGKCSDSHVAPNLSALTDRYRPGEAMSFRIRWDLMPWTDGMTLATDPAAVAQLVVAGQGDLSGRYLKSSCFSRLAGDTRLLSEVVATTDCTDWPGDAAPKPTPDSYLSWAIYAAPPGSALGGDRPPRSPSVRPRLGAEVPSPPEVPQVPTPDQQTSRPGDLPDRFVVINTVDRLADGTLANCRLTDAPSEDACDVWRDGDEGPALFARVHRPGETLRLSMIVDVRPWTGALQREPVVGQVEQVVLLGGEDEEACARLGRGGPVLGGWSEITGCPLVTAAGPFFQRLGDPRPRQSTWTLTAGPLPTR